MYWAHQGHGDCVLALEWSAWLAVAMFQHNCPGVMTWHVGTVVVGVWAIGLAEAFL